MHLNQTFTGFQVGSIQKHLGGIAWTIASVTLGWSVAMSSPTLAETGLLPFAFSLFC
jgi:hypothetical protein